MLAARAKLLPLSGEIGQGEKREHVLQLLPFFTGDTMMRFWTLHLTPQASIWQLPLLMVNVHPPLSSLSFLPSPSSPSPFFHCFYPTSLTLFKLPLPPRFLSPCSTGTAQVFNSITHNCLARLQGHKGEISKVSSHSLSLTLSPHAADLHFQMLQGEGRREAYMRCDFTYSLPPPGDL